VVRATLERALAIFKTIYGADHPRVAMTLGNLGILHQKLGELPVARTTFERVLAIFEATYGPDHPEVARTRTYLDTVQQELDDQ
jgi:hypothetical protein